MFEGAEWMTASKSQQGWGVGGFPVSSVLSLPPAAQEVLFSFCVRMCLSACLE